MTKTPQPRRLPQQARGQARIEKILDSAAELFAEIGYEATSTNAIAQRAETSIGSIYQFFPNKDAILHALAERYVRQLHAVHDAALGDECDVIPLDQLYDRIIGGLAEFHERNPGFQSLFFGAATVSQLATAAAELHNTCIERVDQVMARRMPALDPESRRMYARINVEIVKALLPMAASGDAPFRQRVLREIKRVLMAHAAQVVEELVASGQAVAPLYGQPGQGPPRKSSPGRSAQSRKKPRSASR